MLMNKKRDVSSTTFNHNNETIMQYDNKTLHALQDLRDTALQKAMKYYWDPVLGKAHEEYLTMLNQILKECEA